MAYGIATSGSDWNEWHVRDIDTGKDLSDDLKWVKFSGASWTKDNKGFFYSRYDEPTGAAMRETNYFQKLYYHRLGTAQSEDKLIYERPDNKELLFGGDVTDDGHYLIITVEQGTSPKNRLYYKDLTQPDSQVVRAARRLRRAISSSSTTMVLSSGSKPISTLPAAASSPSTPAIPSAPTGRPWSPRAPTSSRAPTPSTIHFSWNI